MTNIRDHNIRELTNYVLAEARLRDKVRLGYGSPTEALPIPNFIVTHQENEKVEDE